MSGLFAACFIAIMPGYISKSVAGSYDNEGIAIMAHLVDQNGEASAGAVSLFAAAAAVSMATAEISAEFAAVIRAAALVNPSEWEYEYIMGRVRELMEEGRGETIMELGQGEDTKGITDKEMAAVWQHSSKLYKMVA